MMSGHKSGMKELKRPTKSGFVGRLSSSDFGTCFRQNRPIQAFYGQSGMAYFEEADIGLYFAE